MRRFEIIDRDAFYYRDIPNGNYDDVILPKRGTISSAGYDFYSVISVTLKPGERKVIPTGIKVMMNDNEFLGIFIRSSLGLSIMYGCVIRLVLLMLITMVILVMVVIFLYV